MIFAEYDVCKECKNTEVIYLCLHCGKCGRTFEDGICTNISKYPPESEDGENDPVRIAVECAPTVFDKEKVIDEIKNQLELSDTCAYESDYPTEVSYYKGRTLGHEIDIEIVEKGGID